MAGAAVLDDKREKRRRYNAAYHLKHREKHLASCAAYYKANQAVLNQYQRSYSKKRRAWLDALKAFPCVDCGRKYPPECMDFDHVNGEKVNGVGAMLTGKRARILAEIAKCELVCANCHRTRTKNRRAKGDYDGRDY